MDGFEAFRHLVVAHDPRAMHRHMRAIETCATHAGHYWPLEAALWDVVGKALDAPSTLFGHAATRLPAYASTCVLRGPAQSWRMAGEVAAATDLAATRRLVRRLADLAVSRVEEPLPSADVAGLRALRAENPGVRIAAGEMQHPVTDLLGRLDADALDVYQPDGRGPSGRGARSS